MTTLNDALEDVTDLLRLTGYEGDQEAEEAADRVRAALRGFAHAAVTPQPALFHADVIGYLVETRELAIRRYPGQSSFWVSATAWSPDFIGETMAEAEDYIAGIMLTDPRGTRVRITATVPLSKLETP